MMISHSRQQTYKEHKPWIHPAETAPGEGQGKGHVDDTDDADEQHDHSRVANP